MKNINHDDAKILKKFSQSLREKENEDGTIGVRLQSCDLRFLSF